MTVPFVGPRLKIERARAHIDEIRGLLAEFRKTVQLRADAHSTADSDLILWTFRFSHPPPERLSILIGDAVHNLRAALDICICDAARLRGQSTKDLVFPFNADEASLTDRLCRAPYTRLGSDIVDAIKAAKPFAGGNAALHGLHNLDIRDKHSALIPTYLVAWSSVNVPGRAKSLIQERLGVDISTARMPIVEGKTTLHLRKGIRPEQVVTPNFDGPTPTFPEGLPFAGEPIVPTLEALAHLVEGLTNSVAAIPLGNAVRK